jgi:hypothetical protein
MSDDPMFVMSMYGNKVSLYKAKSAFYENKAKALQVAIDALVEDVGNLAALCAALAAELPDTGDYCDFDSAVYASMPKHLCDLVDEAEDKLREILKADVHTAT